VLAPRLLAALGDDRTRLPDARALQCFSGIAPVLIRSGLSTVVTRRHACPRFIRQTFHEHAGESIRHSHWARAYYQQQKDRGKKHHTIARALAFKWQRILIRCWHDHTPTTTPPTCVPSRTAIPSSTNSPLPPNSRGKKMPHEPHLFTCPFTSDIWLALLRIAYERLFDLFVGHSVLWIPILVFTFSGFW